MMKEILRNVCQNKGISKYSVKNLGGNAKGEGYLGELSFLIVTDEETKKQLHLVVKKNFLNGAMSMRPQFLNEILLYNEIWPRLNEVQSKLHTKFDAIDDLLDYSDKVDEEWLIMKNLKADGFEMYDKMTPLDHEHASFILKELGKFHALSFALKKINKGDYVELVKKAGNIFRNHIGKMGESGLVSALEVAVKSLDPIEDKAIVDYFDRFLNETEVDNLMSRSLEYEDGNDVFLHGDLWSSNALYKYNEKRELVGMKFLDFQLIFVGSPVQDVAFALYSGASEEVIENIQTYLKIYHDSLTDHYTKIIGEAPHYTLKTLKEEFIKYNKMSFILATIVWKIKATKPEDVIVMSEIEDEAVLATYSKIPYNEIFFCKNMKPIIKHIYKLDTIGW